MQLGHSSIGDYKLWVTTPVFRVDHQDPKAVEEPYFEVLLSHTKDTYDFYVDPVTENWLNLNLTDRNPLARPRDKENLTDEELEFRVEYSSYLARKGGQPLVKLSKRHVFRLQEMLFLKKSQKDVFPEEPGVIMNKDSVEKLLVPGADVMLRALIDALEPLEEVESPKGATTWNAQAIEQRVRVHLASKKLQLKEVAPSAHVALTGSSTSPGLFDVIAVLGKEKTIERLQRATNYVKNKS